MEHMEKLTSYYPKGLDIETSIQEVSKLLHCTPKHVKTVLHYGDQQQLLNWHAERGRGKHPRIRMNVSKDDFLFIRAKQSVQQENYHDAFQLMESASVWVQQQFKDWFLKQFNHIQMESDRELDVFRYPFYNVGLIMDPMYAKSRHDSHMIQQIFNRLVEYDRESDELVPSLAHNWESEDGINWYFYLHKGIHFHHGKRLTSDDVKQSFNRLRKLQLFKHEIEWITTPSITTVHFQLNKINWIFPRYLAKMSASIIPMDVLKEVGEQQFQKFPVGSGPYQLTVHNNDKIRLEAFNDYFGKRSWIDRVDIIQTPKLYQSDLDSPFLLESPDQSWHKLDVIEEGAEFILFNDNTEICQDIDTRKMIRYCIHRYKFQKHQSRKIPAHSFLSEQSRSNSEVQQGGSSCEEPKGNLQSIIHRKIHRPIRIAAQQIREDAHHRPVAEILQKQLEDLGIQSIIEMLPVENYYKDIKHYDLFVGGVMLGEDRLLSLVSNLYGSTISISECIHESEMRTELIHQLNRMKQEKEDSKRWNIYFKLEEQLISKHYIYFLSHRTHSIYEPSDHHYGSLQLDQNGRVDYRRIWKRW